MSTGPMPDDLTAASDCAEDGAPYSLEVLAKLSGVSGEAILRYREQGLLSARPESRAGSLEFDPAALLALRRIEHLREACGLNLHGLKLMMSMAAEIERLRGALRLRR